MAVGAVVCCQVANVCTLQHHLHAWKAILRTTVQLTIDSYTFWVLYHSFLLAPFSLMMLGYMYASTVLSVLHALMNHIIARNSNSTIVECSQWSSTCQQGSTACVGIGQAKVRKHESDFTLRSKFRESLARPCGEARIGGVLIDL